jgi:hypothetical protein
MAAQTDPWQALKALDASTGLRATVALDKRDVTIGLEHLAFAAETASTLGRGLPPPAPPPGMTPQQIAAATFLIELDAGTIGAIEQAAIAGDPAMAKLRQAVSLAALAEPFAASLRIARRKVAGDAAAIASVEQIARAATEPGPLQAKARGTAFLLARALKQAAAEAALAAEQAPAATPAGPEGAAAPKYRDAADAYLAGDPSVRVGAARTAQIGDVARAVAPSTPTQAPADAAALEPERRP